MTRYKISVPDLALEGVPVTVSTWFVDPGSTVAAGEPVVEILAGAVTVDLASEEDGRLIEQCVLVDEAVQVGEPLAVLEKV